MKLRYKQLPAPEASSSLTRTEYPYGVLQRARISLRRSLSCAHAGVTAQPPKRRTPKQAVHKHTPDGGRVGRILPIPRTRNKLKPRSGQAQAHAMSHTRCTQMHHVCACTVRRNHPQASCISTHTVFDGAHASARTPTHEGPNTPQHLRVIRQTLFSLGNQANAQLICANCLTGV